MSRAPKLNLIQPEIRGQDPWGRGRGAKLLSGPGRFFRDGARAVPGRIFPDDFCTLPVNGAACVPKSRAPRRRTPYALCLPIMYGLPWFTRGNLVAREGAVPSERPSGTYDR